MPPRVWPQPLVVVRDVARSRDFYLAAHPGRRAGRGDLRRRSGAAGAGSRPRRRSARTRRRRGRPRRRGPLGNGILFWFEVSDFDAAIERARSHGAEIVTDVHVNPNANQRELWLRDPDGYTVVLAGPSEYRPR